MPAATAASDPHNNQSKRRADPPQHDVPPAFSEASPPQQDDAFALVSAQQDEGDADWDGGKASMPPPQQQSAFLAGALPSRARPTGMDGRSCGGNGSDIGANVHATRESGEGKAALKNIQDMPTIRSEILNVA
jgi:hypothetical protein